MEAETGKSFDEVLIEHGEMLNNDIKSLSDSLESKTELRFSNQTTKIFLASLRAEELHKSIVDETKDMINSIKQVNAPSRK